MVETEASPVQPAAPDSDTCHEDRRRSSLFAKSSTGTTISHTILERRLRRLAVSNRRYESVSWECKENQRRHGRPMLHRCASGRGRRSGMGAWSPAYEADGR